jgi:hypothetical protein
MLKEVLPETPDAHLLIREHRDTTRVSRITNHVLLLAEVLSGH